MELTNKKALIVDDEVDLARVLSLSLQQTGMKTSVVHTIDNAIEEVNSTNFDIIISDIYLPHKTGKDLFDYVIKHKIEVPFIFMTGNPDVQMAVNFIQKGGYDYIIKPFHINDFIKKVEIVLQKYKDDVEKKGYVSQLREVLDMRMNELKIYKDIYQSLKDIIIITDTEGKIVTSNKALQTLSGYSEEEMKDKTPEILFDKKISHRVFSQIMNEVRDKGVWEGDLASISKDENKWDAIVNVISVKDEGDKTFAYGWQLKDITLLRQTQAQMLEFFGHMNHAQEAIIFGLAKLSEYRDVETGFHLERMRAYTKLLAQKLVGIPEYSDSVNDEFIKNIYKTAPLHDIGKVGISDDILLKKGKLSEEEFDLIKEHTTIGYQTLKSIKTQYGEMDFLNMGLDITYYHHEKWDGTGYPLGLKEKEIPICARITAFADVYDALTSERIYKPAYSHEKAVQIIADSKGTHFDPGICEIFIKHSDEFNRVRKEYGEEKESSTMSNVK
ncbi:MAG: response regulator [Calditrichia bacterium]|nr:response regulator [Calditrichia bacterium]